MTSLRLTYKNEYRYIYSSGKLTTTKTNENLFFESMYEKNFLLLLIFDLKVKSIKTQPFTIQWHNGDYSTRYTPDRANA